ncbi:MAG: chromosome segregation protein SMC [Anaerolineae bacterium]
MHLKSLEVQGYKSFANKVEFVFDKGITAVVGPNGSGKSNVADAIRWVLGEQSYSNLRGKKTEDMIFSGSDGRARLGMASATLVLDNSDRWLPLDFSEVTISRRAYRSGENEYYLNGSRVRLKDVNELLAKGGLSRQTYTVIGQGTIDRVLSLHSEERRRLFEEAAGIVFHRQKRADALDKLKNTQDNLLRLNDIVKEIEPRLKRLEKQAERAQEYELVKTHLDGLLRVWYGYRWRQAQLKLRDAIAGATASESRVAEQRAALQGLSRQIDELVTRQTEARASLSLWYSENNRLNKQAEALQRELAVSEERGRQYAAQRDEILAELGPLNESLAAQRELVAQGESALQEIDRELESAQAQQSEAQRRLDAHQSQLRQAEAQQEAAQKQSRHLADSLSQRRARLSQLGERRDTLLAERDAQAAEVERLQAQQQELQQTQAQLTEKLAALDADLAGLTAKQERQRDALATLNQTAEKLKSEMTALEQREGALKARLDVLDKLRADMSGYFAGVRAVLQPETNLPGILGTISQLVQAPPDLEIALEAALGGRLQDVVVESFRDAETAIEHLKSTRGGRATFLPLDTLRSGSPAEAPNLPGVVGLASELVTVADERLRPVVEFALNRTVIADDLPAARRAFEAMQGGFQIVTREGELMRSGGSVTGGRAAGKQQQEGTFLAREREWRELPTQLEAIAAGHNSLSAQLADNHEQANALKSELQSLADQIQQAENKRREMQAVLEKLSRGLEQVENSINWQQDLQAKAAAEMAQIDERRQAIEQDIEQMSAELAQAEAEAARLAQEAQSLSADSLRAEFNQARAVVEAIKGRRQNQLTLLTTNRHTERQLAGQIDSKQSRAGSLAAEREALLAKQQELLKAIGQFDGQLSEFGEKIRAGEKELAELESSQVQLQHQERNLRQRLQRLEMEHNRLSLEAGRCQNDLDNLQHQIHEDLGFVQLEMSEEQIGQPVLPIVNDLPAVEELPAGVAEDVKRLKVQIRRLGSINPEAPREYAETSERYTFLSEQISDLEAAVTDLREIISKLDAAMEESFVETFQKVAKEFQRYFKALFGGGEAKLLLTDPDNLINTGVDIVARPPGKRLQSMALLSGGERSLTAQALIFALLRISPTPFVIFDEVDAMLDEANVGRFRDALSNLASEIQFIVITHNRKTIEAANTLYGISMGDNSVSQAFSLRIDEWLAERAVAR